jgi:hypothetical protein
MAELALAASRPQLTVIEGGLSRTSDNQWIADEARMELQAYRAEEQTFDLVMTHYLPTIRRLARYAGGQDYRAIEVVAHMLARHARHWADPEPEAA